MLTVSAGRRWGDGQPTPTPTPPPGSVKYGSDGTSWASLTPAWDAPASTVVGTAAALTTALANARSGDVIHLQAGTYGDLTLTGTSLAGAAGNVLVRNVPGAHVEFNNLRSQAPNVTLAGLHLTGYAYLDQGADRNRVARCRVHDNATLMLTSASACEWVECVALERTVAGNDRAQIKAYAGAPAPDGFLIDRCWLEGKDYDGGTGHVDTLQWTAMAGTHVIRSSFIGKAGNNGTTQAKGENQPAGVPYGVLDCYDTWFNGGGPPLGQGNSTSQAGTDRRTRCVFSSDATGDGRLLVYPGAVLTDCQWTGLSVQSGANPAITGCSTVPASVNVPPTFTAPPWWPEIG